MSKFMNQVIKKTIGTAIAALMAITSIGTLPVAAAEMQMAVVSEAPSLNKTNMTLTKGYKFTLTLDGSTSGLTYKSADPAVATVSSKGKVVGKSVGSTVIYVSDGDNVYSCTVKVVATKAVVGKKSYTIKKGSTQNISINVKGVKKLKAVSKDKSVATVSWGKEWNGDEITLMVKAKEAGSTTIQVYNPDYPNYYTSIKVTVPSINPLSTNISSITTSVGLSYKFNVSGDAKNVVVKSRDTSVATVKATSKDGHIEISVCGCSAGTTSVAVANAENAQDSITIPVTVVGTNISPNAKYYIEREYTIVNPSSMTITARSESDKIVYWADKNTSKLMYALVPYSYVPEDDEYCVPVSAIIDTSVCGYDGDAYYWYMVSKDSRYYCYRPLDIAHPKNNPLTVKSGEKLVWKINSKGIVEYMIVPNFNKTDYSGYEYVLNHDGTSYFVTANYYKAINAIPRKKLKSDIVLSWNNDGKVTYMLVPTGYDKVRAETVSAKETGVYKYYTIYSSKPRKSVSSDIIIDYWNDSVEATRYILVPHSYNEDKVDNIIDNDIATSVPNEVSNTQEVIDGINSERVECGISVMIVDDALTEAAKERATELSKKFSHKRPDGSSYVTALEDAGAVYSDSDEIILRNMEYPSDVLTELFEDSDYRDIILSSRNKKVGIAYNSDKDYYVIIVTD